MPLSRSWQWSDYHHFWDDSRLPDDVRRRPLGLLASGPLGLWASGPLGLWASGPLGLWASGPLGLWASGPLGLWASGPLGLWASGPLGLWASGPLGLWASGLLGILASGHLGISTLFMVPKARPAETDTCTTKYSCATYSANFAYDCQREVGIDTISGSRMTSLSNIHLRLSHG